MSYPKKRWKPGACEALDCAKECDNHAVVGNIWESALVATRGSKGTSAAEATTKNIKAPKK